MINDNDLINIAIKVYLIMANIIIIYFEVWHKIDFKENE